MYVHELPEGRARVPELAHLPMRNTTLVIRGLYGEENMCRGVVSFLVFTTQAVLRWIKNAC